MQRATQSWTYLALGEDTCLSWPRSSNSNAIMSGCNPRMRSTLQIEVYITKRGLHYEFIMFCNPLVVGIIATFLMAIRAIPSCLHCPTSWMTCWCRPLVLGRRTSDDGDEWCVASEDCAFGPIGFQRVRDVLPGEMIVITEDGEWPNTREHH